MTAVRRVATVTGCCVAAVVLARPSHADAACDAVEKNLVGNCGFEAGDPPTGWSGFGALSRDTAAPHSGAASLRGASALSFTTQRIWADSTCFALGPGGRYAYGGWTRVTATTTTVICGAFLVSYPLAGCAGQSAATSTGAPAFHVADGWRSFAGTTTTAPGTVSGRMQLMCTGGGTGDTFTAGFDDMFLTALVDVFSDGFE